VDATLHTDGRRYAASAGTRVCATERPNCRPRGDRLRRKHARHRTGPILYQFYRVACAGSAGHTDAGCLAVAGRQRRAAVEFCAKGRAINDRRR